MFWLKEKAKWFPWLTVIVYLTVLLTLERQKNKRQETESTVSAMDLKLQLNDMEMLGYDLNEVHVNANEIYWDKTKRQLILEKK